MSAKKSDYEKRSDELDAHYAARRVAGLPFHRVQVHTGSAGGVEVRSVAGSVFLGVLGGEVELDQTGVFELIQQLQAAFQAVS